MRKNINEKIKELLMENDELLIQAVQNLNSWNGGFDDLRFYDNDEDFFRMFFEGKTMEAIRATQFGHYSYNDDYVRFNGYGNLDTYSYSEMVEEIKSQIEEIVESCIENYNNIYIDEITDIIEELEEELEEEEEEDDEDCELDLSYNEE